MTTLRYTSCSRRGLGVSMSFVMFLSMLLPLMARSLTSPANPKKFLYINILVNNPKNAVKAKITEKIDNSKLPNPLKRIVGFGARKGISKIISPAKVAKMMSTKIPMKMSKKMKGNGLSISIEPVFLEDRYLVLQLTVNRVELGQLAETALKEKLDKPDSKIPKWVEKFERLIGEDRKDKLQTKVVPDIIQSKLCSNMPEMMSSKLDAKQMDADIVVLPEEDQARFFYNQIKVIRSKTYYKKKKRGKEIETSDDDDEEELE